MKRKLMILGVALVIAIPLWAFGNRIVIAQAIAPPNASASLILKYAVHSKYQIAAPHRTLFGKLRLTIIPSAEACVQQCDGSYSKAGCWDSVCGTTFCGRCPDCQNGPCVPYYCVEGTKKNSLCGGAPANCGICPYSQGVSCRTIP
jgi:hypothetical protein